ncbi:MAG: TlpA disulfide reductase family protein [Planctomycetia bacterium]|nr:TlpA disulfide reductase family protein [Planctomycetia bacterium]
MNRLRLFCTVIALCTTPCPAPAADEKPSPGAKSENVVVVRLLDVDGKAIEGAHVSDFGCFGGPADKTPGDESGWRYYSHAVSDGSGTARITDEHGRPDCIIARHVHRRLAAIESLAEGQSNGVITITMRPECRLFGRLVSKELAARNRKITWSNVDLHMDGKRPLACTSEQAEFHFYVPPGTYEIEAYGEEVHAAWKKVTVQPGRRELDLGAIEMPPKRLVLLEGLPAPELRDVVAWKNSESIRLSDLRGKVVLLEFWGYWCGPCVGEMPDLFSLYDKYHEQGLVVIGVHVDSGVEIDSPAKLDEKLAGVKRTLWKGRDIPFPVAMVVEHRVPFRPDVQRTAACPLAAEYGIDDVPAGVLIDRQGRVVGGFHVGFKPDLTVLEKTLKEK